MKEMLLVALLLLGGCVVEEQVSQKSLNDNVKVTVTKVSEGYTVNCDSEDCVIDGDFPEGTKVYALSCKMCSSEFGAKLAEERNNDLGLKETVFSSDDYSCFAVPNSVWEAEDFEQSCKDFEWITSDGYVFKGILDKEEVSLVKD